MSQQNVSPDAPISQPTKSNSGSKCPRANVRAVGFDAVVEKERIARLAKFRPDSVKIHKPATIIIDIYGVISSWGFTKVLLNFAIENIEPYIVKNIKNSKLIKISVQRLRDEIRKQKEMGVEVTLPEIPLEGENEDDAAVGAIAAAFKKLFLTKEPTMKPVVDSICREMWSQSYDNGSLKVPVYDDVPDTFQYWRFEQFIKIYTYASGHQDGQRQYLRSTVLGDLNRYVANCVDASGGFKFDPEKFRSLLTALRETEPTNLLYFTDDPRKARSSMDAGIRAIVVNRERSTSAKYSPDQIQGLTVIHNISDIQFVENPNPVAGSCC